MKKYTPISLRPTVDSAFRVKPRFLRRQRFQFVTLRSDGTRRDARVFIDMFVEISTREQEDTWVTVKIARSRQIMYVMITARRCNVPTDGAGRRLVSSRRVCCCCGCPFKRVGVKVANLLGWGWLCASTQSSHTRVTRGSVRSNFGRSWCEDWDDRGCAKVRPLRKEMSNLTKKSEYYNARFHLFRYFTVHREDRTRYCTACFLHWAFLGKTSFVVLVRCLPISTALADRKDLRASDSISRAQSFAG